MSTTKETDAKMKGLDELEGVQKHDGVLSIEGQWIDIDRSKISYGGLLYPQSYRFQVKPAQTKTIKYFSSLDEDNAMSVADALTYVVQHHVRILNGNKQIDSTKVVYEHDRLFFVMLVHQYSGAPTSLSFPYTCKVQTCTHLQDADIKPGTLQYKEIEEKHLSWINTEFGGFVINTKTLGTKRFRPLTLQESIDITQFMMESKRDSIELEKLFIKAAPFFMHDRVPGEPIKIIYQKYLKLTSDQNEIALIIELDRLIAPEQKLEIASNCKKCDDPFRTPISSVAGLRNIFVVHDIAAEELYF